MFSLQLDFPFEIQIARVKRSSAKAALLFYYIQKHISSTMHECDEMKRIVDFLENCILVRKDNFLCFNIDA